jgi:type II secretory pathway component PulK
MKLCSLHAPNHAHRDGTRGGYVIFAVLIVIVVLSLVAYRFTDAMTSEYRASVRINDDAQLKMAAVSGLHYAAAVLSDRNTFNTQLNGNPFDNPDIFQEFELPITTSTGNPPARQPYFSIQAVALTDAGGFEQRFGVIDEGGKLNINSLISLDSTGQLLHDALMKLPNMTEDIADAIVDWVDADDDPRASGAETSYYTSMTSPYKSKNGPLNSLDELLLVKGVTPYLLYGGDTNRNGIQDEGEQDNTRGWADYLTVYGRELNVDSTGTARIYLNGDDLDTLHQQLSTAVGDELATYIIASKVLSPKQVSQQANLSVSTSGGTMTLTMTGNNSQNQRPTVTATTDQLAQAVQAKVASSASSGKRIRSLMDLIGTQITLPRAQDAKNTDPDIVAYSPLNDPAKLNDLLPKLLDKTTVKQAIEMVPRINVNTAPREVLMAIPNMTDTLADSIVSQRAGQVPTDPATPSAAWLVTSNTLTSSQFKQMEKYLTGSSMIYRVQAIGYFKGSNGPVARMEAVIDTNQGAPRFLMVRDLSDLENPRGFQPPNTQQ